MANATVLELGPIPAKGQFPSCIPNLMPFHIDYSGTALISSYLRVEAASNTVAAPPPASEKAPISNNEEVENSQNTQASNNMLVDENSQATQASNDTLVDTNSQTEAGEDIKSAEPRITDSTTRFTSSFRGRTIQGLKVQLPDGYGGLVLRSDAPSNAARLDVKSKGKQKAEIASKGRRTRKSARSEVDTEVVDVDEMKVEGDDELILDAEHDKTERAVRTLFPTSQFSSFILWHPDNPVDETSDEYFRSLKEWTRLADEIHKMEPEPS